MYQDIPRPSQRVLHVIIGVELRHLDDFWKIRIAWILVATRLGRHRATFKLTSAPQVLEQCCSDLSLKVLSSKAWSMHGKI